MIVADQILVSLFNSNNYSQTLFNEINIKRNQGEDVCELEWKYILLNQWIRIITDFYNTNFDTEGQIVTPAYETIALAQAQQIISQIKIAVGANKYPLTNIFQLGIWIESLNFYWDDRNLWLDQPGLS